MKSSTTNGWAARLAANVLVLSAIANEASWAEDWPHLRGPQYDARCRDAQLVDRWGDAGPPILWTREFGQGYSGFTAVGDRLFTQSQNLGGQFVVCLDAATGDTRWETRYDWPYEPLGIYPGPRATPTWADGRVYFAAPSGTIGCLDAETGALQWSVDLKQKFKGKGSEFGYSISPTVVDGKVILPVGGIGASLVALDARDGAILWKSGNEPASYVSAYPITLAGRRLMLALMQNSLACYDPTDGKPLWTRELSQGYDEQAAWPLYSEPYLLTCSPFREGSKLYRLSLQPEPRCELVRVSELMSNDVFSSLLVETKPGEGTVFGFDLKDPQAKLQRTSRGMFRAVDFRTGDPLWEAKQIAHAAVLEGDGKLLLWTDLGELILARASREKYDELARAQILGGEITWTQPTLHRNRLYVRNQKRIACVDLSVPRPSGLNNGSASTATMTAADLATAPHQDLTWLLGVDAEYSFDIPDGASFAAWFGLSLGVLALAGAAIGLSLLLARRFLPADCEPSAWWAFWILAFVLGGAATPVLGGWRQELSFTWPASLFVMFQAWVYQGDWGRRALVARPRLWSYVAGAFFLASSLGYFLLCKRLSLVFEWSFLTGFVPAIPFTLLAARGSRRQGDSRTRAWLAAVVGTTLAFSAFYWGAVGILFTLR